MPIFNHFDFLAPIYDRFIKLKSIDPILDLLSLPTSGLLLDACGGTGRVSHPLSNFIGQIIIADQSFGMLQQAASKKELVSVCSLVERLPFECQSFERILIVDAFHHVLNAQNTADELWRILKPGGIILIEEPDIKSLQVKIVAVIEKITLMRSHFLPPNTISNLFAKHNAAINITSQGYTSWIKITKTG